MTDKTQYVVIRDGIVRSVISDIVTFGILIAMMFFNFMYWRGHWYVTIFILFLWFMFALGRATSRRHEFQSIADAIKYLEDLNR